MISMFDLHTHTTASDGTDTPEELMRKALEKGIGTLAITDHDTLSGVREVLGRAPEGLRLIPGVELSCRGKAGKCHILGLGVDVGSAALNEALEHLAGLRRRKLENRIAFLKEQGLAFPEGGVADLRAMPAAGKPHLVGLLVESGLVKSREEGFALLGQCGAGADRIDAKTAIEAILSAGGVPVWAHPRGGVDGAVGEQEFRTLLPELISYGLGGLECFYSMYPLSLCRELSIIARENGLLTSAGSDYHGKNKTVPLGRLCADEAGPSREDVSVLEALCPPNSRVSGVIPGPEGGILSDAIVE